MSVFHSSQQEELNGYLVSGWIKCSKDWIAIHKTFFFLLYTQLGNTCQLLPDKWSHVTKFCQWQIEGSVSHTQENLSHKQSALFFFLSHRPWEPQVKDVSPPDERNRVPELLLEDELLPIGNLIFPFN